MNENAWEWTVTLLSLYGKQCSVVPPCPELPTLRHHAREPEDERLNRAPPSSYATNPNHRSAASGPAQAALYLPRIREALAQGMKQYEIADELKIHPTAVSRLLTNFPNFP